MSSSHAPGPPPEGSKEKPRWLDRKENVDKVFYALCAVCAAVVLADLGYHKHGHFGFENIIGFHAGFGFVAYVSLVTLAKGLRRLVKRPEDYYGE
jgi:hypothetical protein